MSAWLWVGVLVAAAWAAHWGADQLLTPLKMLRKQWGLTASAGAAFLAIVTASPEVAINITRPKQSFGLTYFIFYLLGLVTN